MWQFTIPHTPPKKTLHSHGYWPGQQPWHNHGHCMPDQCCVRLQDQHVRARSPSKQTPLTTAVEASNGGAGVQHGTVPHRCVPSCRRPLHQRGEGAMQCSLTSSTDPAPVRRGLGFSSVSRRVNDLPALPSFDTGEWLCSSRNHSRAHCLPQRLVRSACAARRRTTAHS